MPNWCQHLAEHIVHVKTLHVVCQSDATHHFRNHFCRVRHVQRGDRAAIGGVHNVNMHDGQEVLAGGQFGSSSRDI